MTKHMTFDGRLLGYEQMDHQHLSNICWAGEIFTSLPETVPAYMRARQELDERFGGARLPYRPHPAFRQEAQLLESRSMLFWGEDLHGRFAVIVHKGHVIGELDTPARTRARKIDLLRLPVQVEEPCHPGA